MLPKFISRDCEYSTTGCDARGAPLNNWRVASDVLEGVPEVFAENGAVAWSRRQGQFISPLSSDCLRHWGSNGQCYYCDMGHVEACTALTLRPRQFAAQGLSLLCIAEQARQRAEESAPAGTRYSLSTANVDVLDPGISWGTHLNISIESQLWEDLLLRHRHPTALAFVSSALAAATAFFGAGYVLPLRGGSAIYSLSGRAHHLTQMYTFTTTEAYCRGLLNCRREPHGAGQDRLHLINFDFNPLSGRLLAGFLQCVLAAAESGFARCLLADPLHALETWSWQLDLQQGRLPAEARLSEGGSRTLPAYVRELTAHLLRLCEEGVIPAQVAPEAEELLPRIIELTEQAERGEIGRCARHLDWAAKLLHLCSAGYELASPECRLTDHDFVNTDPARGAFWRLWDEGIIDPLVERAEVHACATTAPEETRDWGRGQLLQRFAATVTDVDWASVELRSNTDRWSPRVTIELPTLDSFRRATFEPLLDRCDSPAELHALLRELRSAPTEMQSLNTGAGSAPAIP